MTAASAVAASAVAADARAAQQVTILVQISNRHAWVIRQVLAADPQPSVCTDCGQAVARARGPDGHRLRVDPTPDADGLYLAHRLSCPAASRLPRREPR